MEKGQTSTKYLETMIEVNIVSNSLCSPCSLEEVNASFGDFEKNT